MKNIVDFLINESNNFKKGEIVTGKLPNGKIITGKFIEIYGNGRFASIKTDDGKEYGVDPKSVEKIQKIRKQMDPETLNARKSSKLKELYRKREEIERDMEDDLSDLSDDIYDGNNPRVKYWARQLDKIDKQIEKIS